MKKGIRAHLKWLTPRVSYEWPVSLVSLSHNIQHYEKATSEWGLSFQMDKDSLCSSV